MTLNRCSKIVVLTLLGTLGACTHTTLEQQFQGIDVCKVKNVFLDPVTHTPSGAYFTERKLEPCRVDEAAFYCVTDTFYGLTVNQVVIPYRGPFSVHALYLNEAPRVVEAALRKQFKGIDLNREEGVTPYLIPDPKQQGRSVFYCDPYSE